jgi:hypothetical protein
MRSHAQRILLSLVAAGIGLSSASCGVNPDRMAAIEERKARLAAQEMAENDKPLEVSEGDPDAIKGAIEAFNGLRASVDEKDYKGYLEGRYALQSTLQFAATEEVATHPKTPIILERIKALDTRVAAVAGERAKKLVAADSRTQASSQDALFAISQGLTDCDKAIAEPSANIANDTYAQYDAAIKRAAGIDSQSLTYVGPEPNGSGFLDVPAEIAVCEARMAIKRIDAADAPKAEEARVQQYEGCGKYEVEIEARQNAPNTFGEYTITSAIALEADPGKAEPFECDQMPPVSDAPAAVQRTVKSGVGWVVPTDIISMAGPFEYEQRDELYKTGVVRIYRKTAALETNACGAKDARVTCEAAGNELATAFNYTTHYLRRADFHRKAANAERCMEMAERAATFASEAPMAAPESETLYEVGADRLTHDQITEQLNGMAVQAKDIAESDWCKKKP